jgi:RNA recognition motif-containing protein
MSFSSFPGFAFIEYDDRRDGEDACRAMDRKVFFGQEIRVEFARTDSGPRRRYDGPYQGGDNACVCARTMGVGVRANMCPPTLLSPPPRRRSRSISPRRRGSPPPYAHRHTPAHSLGLPD